MALNLNLDSGTSINTFSLKKIEVGTSINLSKENPNLKNVILKLTWVGDEDLDATVVLLTPNNKFIRNDATSMVWYNNLSVAGIVHSGDLRSGGTEEIKINLAGVEGGVDKLLLAATTHVNKIGDAPVRFGQVSDAKVYLIDADTNDALYEFDLAGQHQRSTCVEMATLYRSEGGWAVKSDAKCIGEHEEGLQGVLNTYA